MGYNINSGKYAGQFADTRDLVLQPSAAQTATFNGAAFELGDRRVARLKLDVTAASGTTPTLDITVQISRDGVTWYTSGTFAQKTGVSNELKAFLLDRFVRIAATLGGTTPNFTFSVAGETA